MRRVRAMRSFALGLAVCLASGAGPDPAAAQTAALPGTHVALSVAGTAAGVFPVASGIGSSHEVVEHLVGSVTQKIPGRLSWSNVLLERGLTSDRFLWTWRREVEQERVDDVRHNFELTLLDADELPVARWACVNGWPSRISAPRSRVGDALIAVEAVTIVTEGCSRVDLPDTRPPVLDLPGDLVVEATSAAGATVSFTVTASDAADPAPTVSCAPDSGSAFPLGESTVNCTATDNLGNSATGSFAVTVQDTTAPSLTLPAGIVAEAATTSGVTVAYSASATDLVDASPTVSCDPISGSLFPLGSTTVTCTATDTAGNSASGGFTVTVRDTAAPTLTVPADIVEEGTSAAGAVVSFPASATDIADASPTVGCVPASGSTFPLGATTVTCTATDASDNAASRGFKVTVRDTTAPSPMLPADILAEATSATGAAVSFSATATDLVDATPAVDCVPASGSLFPMGATTVTCTATDASGNSTAASFLVTVRDSTGPTVTVPADIVVEATSPAGAVVTFTASATDIVDGSPEIGCVPPSGSTFPLGATTVTCTATDASGNAASRGFKVTVRDTTAPTPTVPEDLVVEATSPTGAVVTFTATAADIVDASPAVDCVPASGSTFPLGATTVTCTATDASDNAASGSFAVTVRDTTAPALTLPADIAAAATSAAGAAVSFSATATDLVDATPEVDCVPASGSLFPMGTTTVTCTASDDAGNSATGTFTVSVADTTPPEITLEILEAAPHYTNGSLTVRYTVADAVDPSPVATFEFSNNGDPFGAPPLLAPAAPAAAPAGATDVAFDPRALAGRNTVRVTATDAAGNSAQATLDFAVVLKLVGKQLEIKPEYLLALAGRFTARATFPAPYDAWTITAASADGAPLVNPKVRLGWRTGHSSVLSFNRSRIIPPVDTSFVVTGTFRYKGYDCAFEGEDTIRGVLIRKR